MSLALFLIIILLWGIYDKLPASEKKPAPTGYKSLDGRTYYATEKPADSRV
jgi:hypothetical protein